MYMRCKTKGSQALLILWKSGDILTSVNVVAVVVAEFVVPVHVV